MQGAQVHRWLNILSERGFGVLRYDKRGTANLTILDTNIWGNATINDLIHDAEKALNILTLQPEVDPKRISIIGHSEGTIIAPRVAIDNSTKVRNIVLMGIAANNLRDGAYYQDVYQPLSYAKQVLDKNHTGLISIQQIAKDPVLIKKLYNKYSCTYCILANNTISQANNTKAITNTLAKLFRSSSGYISIDRQLKPLFIKGYENETAFNI
ncbi:MAG: alpha/beta hydrolase [Candidatus Nitrosopolaris sp.]